MIASARRVGGRLRSGARAVLREVENASYGTARARYRRRHRRRREAAADRIVVFQMGKVGSSTVRASLRAALPDWLIDHAHVLTEPELAEGRRQFRAAWSRAAPNPTTLWESELLREELREGRESDRLWTLVTMVRDPVARNVSAFFEIMDLQLGFGFHRKLETLGLARTLEELEALFWRGFPRHDFPLRWFDEQLKGAFGVDVFERSFERERGYGVVEGPRVRVLVLKLERLSECVGPAMEEFLGLTDFRLVRKNVGGDKHYSDAYRAFLERVRVPPAYLDRMYGSALARHFYTAAELDGFRSLWSGRTGATREAIRAEAAS